MRFALIGQPNCGKSTLFNQVAGYRAETGNFPGTTVTFIESKVRVMGEVVDLVDLPGTYTLAGSNPAEQETLRYLASHEVDVIINVIDATQLVQSLSLTLELLELQRPMMVALNMMDEALHLGMEINGPKLQELLGVPVLPLVASKGRGVRDVFVTAHRIGKTKLVSPRPRYNQDVEEAINTLAASINGKKLSLPAETLAIRLLEGDSALLHQIKNVAPQALSILTSTRNALEMARGLEVSWVINDERHRLAERLAQAVIQQGERRVTWKDRLDDLLLHPFWGYVFLIGILLLFFEGIYGIGSRLEAPLLAFFDALIAHSQERLWTGSLAAELITGVLQGISGGMAIVLPYLVPFLLGLGFLEDIGYLPRVAFLMDALMHRIGLHGKAVVPFILGYGCNVPAIMSTRVLEDRRDRFMAAALATMVPCAARLAVVFGLVAFYMGPRLALGIYLFNLFIIALVGRLLSGLMKEEAPGLILEVPLYRMPMLKAICFKAWFRTREFIVEAWPILILGSVILALLSYLNLANSINLIIRPVTWILGLPKAVGVPLIFGVLRKELSLIMLKQALGGNDFSTLLTPVQMITFTIFVVFYVPCLATMAVLRRELGGRNMSVIAGLTVLIAVITGLIARGLASIFY